MPTSNDPTTIPEMFYQRVARTRHETALKHKRAGQWRSLSWNTLEQRVRRLGRALAGWLEPGEMACILSENRPEWWIADLATLSAGCVSAPIYPTNPPKDIAYIINDCGARVLLASSAEQLAKIRELREAGQVPKLERVVVFDDDAASAEEQDWVTPLGPLLAEGSAPDGADDPLAARLAAIDPDSLATLIYTSGTTGEPKGVMLTHKNIVSNVLAAEVLLGHLDRMNVTDRVMLSFLPLSHSLERTAGYYVAIRYGFSVAFAESIPKLLDNMAEVRPTVLVSVPRIYEKIHARVMQQAEESPVKRAMVHGALKLGHKVAGYRLANKPVPLHLALAYQVADRVIFSKIKAKLGGRFAFAISGGAPLAKEIAEFLNALGLAVFEGYGLSETAPVLTANRPDAVRPGTVGKPLPGVEIKIAPEPDRTHDGEILAKGPNVMKGYFNKPEATAEVFDDEGWFRTGDIGYFDRDGFLVITDRKKELIKTAGGKYVAPQPVENQLKIHRLVAQAVLVGDRRKYCVALLVPDFEALEQTLGRALPESTREHLNQDPAVVRLYQEAVDDANRDRGSWEQIKRFHLLPAEMTQETGELTPSLKVKRRVVEEKFSAQIDAMYPG